MILTHYYPGFLKNEKNKTLLCITDYEYDVQKTISNSLAIKDARALRRFKEFDKYISKRNIVEMWLYQTFVTKGGKPNILHPFYFIVGENEQLKRDFGSDANFFQINTDKILSEHISFTVGDSMAIFNSNPGKDVYTIDDIKQIIKTKEIITKQFSYINKYHQYIEAQLWDKKYLEILDNL